MSSTNINCFGGMATTRDGIDTRKKDLIGAGAVKVIPELSKAIRAIAEWIQVRIAPCASCEKKRWVHFLDEYAVCEECRYYEEQEQLEKEDREYWEREWRMQDDAASTQCRNCRNYGCDGRCY